MTHPNRRQQEIEREARRRKVAAILLSGVDNQTAIAEQLGVGQSTISRDIAAIESEWQAEARQDIATAKGKDLRRTDRAIQAIWQKVLSGDERAVAEFVKLMQHRAKLLGLNAPEKRELIGRDGGPVQFEMSEQVRRLAEQYGTTEEEVLALANDTGGDE